MVTNATAPGASAPNPAALRCILDRRSLSALVEPAPTADELAVLFHAATTVPDHGELKPFRFVVVSGDARGRFGDALAAATAEARPDSSPALLDKVRQKAFAAPLQIVLIAAPRAGAKIPEWEQTASAACTGYAIALAAHALGLGAIWKSAAYCDGAALRALLALQANERLLGWINLGRPAPTAARAPRPDIDLGSVASVLATDGLAPFAAPSAAASPAPAAPEAA